MSNAKTLLTGLVSGLGLVVSGGYFVFLLTRRDDSAERALWARLEPPGTYERRRRRRTLGMAMMALISVVFFLGANYMNPEPHPRLALLFWVVLLTLLMWLCVLAMIDLADARRLRQRLLQASREMFYEEMGRCKPTGQPRDEEEG